MNTPIQDPIAHACRLLREAAEELKTGHTLAKTGHDWAGEPEAKAAYDEHIAAADALAALTTAAVPLQITAPPNIEGETQLVVRWLVETPVGRVGAWNRASLEYLLGSIPAQAAPAAAAGPDRQTLIDVIAQGLSGTWHCLRVWNAWSFGTMSQDDFVPVDESDTPAELADAVLALLSTAPAPRSMRAAKEGAKHG